MTKVQVIVKNSEKTATTASTTIEAALAPSDTALSLSERVATATNILCFPDQTLHFNGKDLPSSRRLSECGVKSGDVLELAFKASDATLADQLAELLGNKALSTEELGLLYIHRHLVSVADALKALGHTKGKLKDFLACQKCFCMDGDIVKAAKCQEAAALKSPCQAEEVRGPIEVKVCVEVHVPGQAPECLTRDEDEDDMGSLRLDASETVAKAKQIMAAYEQVPFPDRDLLLGEKKLEDSLTVHEAGIRNGDLLVLVVHASEKSLVSQLEALLCERVALSANELSLHYCQRFGTPINKALRTLGLRANLSRFLEAQPQFLVSGGCVTLANGPKLVTKAHDTAKGLKIEEANSAGPPCFQ